MKKKDELRVLLTRSMVDGDIEYLRKGLDRLVPGEYELIVPDDYTEASLAHYAATADVLLGPYVTTGILDSAKCLRLIQVPWTGMDNFNFVAVRGRGIAVCNTHSNADAVAEMAVTLALDLLKKVSYHDRKMRKGNWNRDQRPLDLCSRIVKDQTICVLGYGNIGARIGRLFGAFGARVIAVDDRSNSDDVQVFSTSSMYEALSTSDLVICTVPLTPATEGLLEAKAIASMKKGSLLVNVSRAKLTDEDAVWDALDSDHLGGFASDVWWNAPKRGESESWSSERHPFWERENVVLSPHRAGFVEGSLPHLDGAIDNIAALVKGMPLKNVVDVEKGF